MSTIVSSSVNSASATYFTFDHIHKTIVGSEINFKRAGNPNSEQYADLMKVMALRPTYELAPIPAKKKVEKKQTYAGLNMKLMKDFLELFGTDDEQKVYNKMVDEDTPYPTVKSWFLEDRKNFSVSKAQRDIANVIRENNKNEIRKAAGVQIKAKVKPAKAKIIKAAPALALTPAANQ